MFMLMRNPLSIQDVESPDETIAFVALLCYHWEFCYHVSEKNESETFWAISRSKLFRFLLTLMGLATASKG